MNTISKLLGQYMAFDPGVKHTTQELNVDLSLLSLKVALEEYKAKDDLVAATVKECFAKVYTGTRIQKLHMVVFAALCKKLPDTSGEETDTYLSHITEYLERNTSSDGYSLLGCKAGKGGGHFLWANEPDNT